EGDNCERPDLGAEERIVGIVVPALRGEDRPGKTDDEDKAGERAVRSVDRRRARNGGVIHPGPHAHEFRKQNGEHSEHEEVVQDGTYEIKIEHRSVLLNVGFAKSSSSPYRSINFRIASVSRPKGARNRFPPFHLPCAKTPWGCLSVRKPSMP